MPVYHFTYYTHGAWLPDRLRGYVKRKRGILPTDHVEAARYRRQMHDAPVRLTPTQIEILADEISTAARFQQLQLFGFAITDQHVHTLVGWADERHWKLRRSKLKESLTRRLNREFGKRVWWVDGSSRKRVRERSHFEHLRATYLPGHAAYGKVEIVPLTDPRAVGPRLLERNENPSENPSPPTGEKRQ